MLFRSKCGNVAVDETDMCDHIKYAKLNTFHDEQGIKRVIAELCGHPTIDETAGVTFIEASWVATPAFTGAALRNVIEPARMSDRQAQQIQEVLSQPPKQWSDTANVKAAGLHVDLGGAQIVGTVDDRRRIAAFDFGDEDGGGEGEGEGEGGAAPAEPADPLKGVEDELHGVMLDRVMKRIKKELSEQDVEEALNPEDSTAAPNDTVIKQGATRLAARRAKYNIAADAVIRTASSDADLLNRLVLLDRAFGLEANPVFYRAALQVGSTRKYGSSNQFWVACRRALGGPLDHPTAQTMLRLGKSLSALETTPKETRS